MSKTYHTQKDKMNSVLEEPIGGLYSPSLYQLAFSEISKKYIKRVIKRTKLQVNEFIEILPISIDTYKRKSTFNPPVTEKVLEIEEIYNRGLEAFGESFYDWMGTTNPALGNVTPKALLINSFGIRMLLDEIGRLEHGILA
ncbi:MAG: antitoxin Xre/MbcA/ParS toxin-binding domain-containing protein [Bacteroidota bacterium]